MKFLLPYNHIWTQGMFRGIVKKNKINIKIKKNMPKVKPHLMNRSERYKIIGNFFEIVAGLKNKKEVVDFLFGLLTPSEILMMARRIEIAQMLLEGKSYENIRIKLKVSNQTITKTDNWLHRDDEYNRWLEGKLKGRSGKNKKMENSGMSLDKYVQHRFLKNLLS